MRLGLIICTVLALMGCSKKEMEQPKENIIPHAEKARADSKYALLKDIAEDIESAARRGRTEETIYLRWFNTEDIVELVIVLRKRGYRVTFRNEEEGISQGQWLDISWGSSDGKTDEPSKE